MKSHATIRRSPGGGEALWDVLVDGTPVMTEQTYIVASNVEWSLNTGACGVTECDEVAAAILAKHPACCSHEYMEALNFGNQKDNVECRKCGQFWLRHDRATTSVVAVPDAAPVAPVKAEEFPLGTLVVDAAGNHSFVGKVTEIRSDGVVKVEWESGIWLLTHPGTLRRKD